MTASATKLKKLLKRLHGWMCYRLFMAVPDVVSAWVFRNGYPLWVHVVAWAGFYVSLGRSQ